MNQTYISKKEYTAMQKNQVSKQAAALTLFVFLMVLSTFASAALDPAVATTFTTIQSDFTSMIGIVWPVIGAVFAALGIIGLVRAALNRGGIRA